MPVPTLDEFREILRTRTANEVVESAILAPEAKHLTQEDISEVERVLRLSFHMDPADQISVHLVGSAKLGFSLVDKSTAAYYKPRYRDFTLDSDFDFAIVSQKLYYKLWRELSLYSHRQHPFPWNSKLAAYMLIGWIRPDHFPTNPRPSQCQTWWELFGQLSTERRFGGRRVRGALFFTKPFLIEYQSRAVLDCQLAEPAA